MKRSSKGISCIWCQIAMMWQLGSVLKNNAFSSALTVHACASVISRSIKSVYPPVNGILDPSVSILNALFPQGL